MMENPFILKNVFRKKQKNQLDTDEEPGSLPNYMEREPS